MVHLYALVDHPARLPPLAGIGGETVSAAEAAGIDAIFSEHDDPAADATDAAVLAHARLVEAVAALNAAVLPARFPGRYESEAALRDNIRDRASDLCDALDRVRGCVEVGVRVVPSAGIVDERARSGGDYMRGRLAAIREAEGIARELDAAVAPIVREGTRSVAATSQLVLSAAYLVASSEAADFRPAVETVARRHPDLAYVCFGPWPPYSFALVDGPPR
jgi:hypothetical protein